MNRAKELLARELGLVRKPSQVDCSTALVRIRISSSHLSCFVERIDRFEGFGSGTAVAIASGLRFDLELILARFAEAQTLHPPTV